jgi:hypothetical protein
MCPKIGFPFDPGYGVKALLANGLEGAIFVLTVQKLAIDWGTHGKLQHVVT